MTHDPIIDEIRRIRDENAQKHQFNAESMGREFIAQQKKSKHPVVNRHRSAVETRKPPRAKAS